MSDISESLREEQGRDEVADQQNGEDEAGDVLDAHSRSTPFTISAAKAKKATVRTTNTTSAMQTPIIRWSVRPRDES